MAGATFKKLGDPVHNGASVAAGSDIISADRAAPRNGILHVTIAVDTSTTVQLGVEDAAPGSGTEELMDLNGGVGLSAGTLYIFPVPALAGFSYSLVNKSGETATTIQHAHLMLETPVG